MDILVVGAGVLGSLYAARLAGVATGVRIVARGKRADEIERHGIELVDEAGGRTSATRIRVVRALDASVTADAALVLVRRNHVPGLLPSLARIAVPTIVFMTNNAAGQSSLADAIGADRLLLGFPGAGGCRVGRVVHYRRMSRLLQPTMLGEPDGRTSARLIAVAAALRDAGFPVRLESRMDAWLKTHAAVVSPVAHAIYAAGGSTHALGRRPRIVRELVVAVRENLDVLRALGFPVVPGRYAALLSLPTPVIVTLLAAGFRTERAELVLARHANAARDEMAAILADLDALGRQAHMATPHAARLAEALRA